MNQKLDPQLLHLAEAPLGMDESTAEVRVMLALHHAPDDAEVARLEKHGLTMGSAVGDIVTGTVPVSDLARLARDPLIIKIEGSRPLDPEAP